MRRYAIFRLTGKTWRVLLGLAGMAPSAFRLTPEQIEDLKIAIAQADRGEFSTDEDMDAAWKKFGL